MPEIELKIKKENFDYCLFFLEETCDRIRFDDENCQGI